MSIEAMKQALEALEWDADYDTSVTLQKTAITALRQAIYEQTFWEDPAGFPVYTRPVYASDISEKHVHESDKDRHEHEDDLYDIWVEQGTCQENRQVAKNATTWVGLTDQEIYDIRADFTYDDEEFNEWGFAKDIEAKLKEKNI